MIKVYIDAATKGNPGPSGIGILIVQNKTQWIEKKFFPSLTNHQAEFQALIEALRLLKKYHFENEWIVIYSDSQLVLDTIKKRQVKKEQFKPYFTHLFFLLPFFPTLSFQWLNDQKHKGAHTLAIQALHQH